MHIGRCTCDWGEVEPVWGVVVEGDKRRIITNVCGGGGNCYDHVAWVVGSGMRKAAVIENKCLVINSCLL